MYWIVIPQQCYCSVKSYFISCCTSSDKRRYAISSSGKVYEVSVGQIPSCTCPSKSKKPDQICKHLIWVYLYVLEIGEQRNLIQQVGLTKSELSKMFKDAPVNVPKNVSLPEGVESTISQARHSTNEMPQEWIITRKDHPKIAHCSGLPCFNRIEKGDLHLAVKGLYCPPNKRPRSNMSPLQSNVVFIEPNATPTDSEMQLITDRGFQTKLKIRIGEPG